MKAKSAPPPSVAQKVAASSIESMLEGATERALAAQLNPNLRVDPAVLATPPPATPPPETFNSLLAQAGEAPGATSVVTVASQPQEGDFLLETNAQMLDSYIAVLAAWVMYTKHPEPYDLSNPGEAAQFVIDLANARNYVVTGGVIKAIPMYLPLGQATTQRIEESTTSANLHTSLLNAMFGGFGLPEAAIGELDSILTEVTQTLANLKLEFSDEEQTLNHFLSFYHLVPVEGSEPPIHVMQGTFMYLEIDQKSWKASLGKSSLEHFSFDMDLTKTSGTMSTGMVSANTSTIANALHALTEHDPKTISEFTGLKGTRV